MILIGTSVISFLYLSFSFFNTDNSSSKDRACLCKFFISFLCSLLAALRCFTLDLSSSLLLFRLSSAFSTSSKEEYPHQIPSLFLSSSRSRFCLFLSLLCFFCSAFLLLTSSYQNVFAPNIIRKKVRRRRKERHICI